MTERLLAQADDYLARGRPMPLTLVARLMDAGVDVNTLEGHTVDATATED